MKKSARKLTQKRLSPSEPITLDHGVPMPSPNNRVGFKYPFALMKKGDSFLVPTKLANRARSAASAWTARHQLDRSTFATRATDEGVRIWRMK